MIIRNVFLFSRDKYMGYYETPTKGPMSIIFMIALIALLILIVRAANA